MKIRLVPIHNILVFIIYLKNNHNFGAEFKTAKKSHSSITYCMVKNNSN